MRNRYQPETHKALKAAAVAEIQAIAIYESECFWIRDPSRFDLLDSIRLEEIHHQDFISEWTKIGAFERSFHRLSGWLIGTLLSLLPWKTFCRVQSWAENQAKEVYVTALRAVEADPSIAKQSILLGGLREAVHSESQHAERFRTIILES